MSDYTSEEIEEVYRKQMEYAEIKAYGTDSHFWVFVWAVAMLLMCGAIVYSVLHLIYK